MLVKQYYVQENSNYVEDNTFLDYVRQNIEFTLHLFQNLLVSDGSQMTNRIQTVNEIKNKIKLLMTDVIYLNSEKYNFNNNIFCNCR